MRLVGLGVATQVVGGCSGADELPTVDLGIVPMCPPQLHFWNADYVDRESRWAAQGLTTSGLLVRVAYMFSYYRDEGPVGWCPIGGELCEGHNGDSELAVIDVRYNSATQHWLVDTAHFHQHGHVTRAARSRKQQYPINAYSVTGWGDTVLYPVTYPQRAGGFLRVFVAQGKHASYFHTTECDAGGFEGSDECDDLNSIVRLNAPSGGNIGSRQVRFIDCVLAEDSQHPYYGAGRIECYWNEQPFRGWFPEAIGGGHAGAYGPKLSTYGF